MPSRVTAGVQQVGHVQSRPPHERTNERTHLTFSILRPSSRFDDDRTMPVNKRHISVRGIKFR